MFSRAAEKYPVVRTGYPSTTSHMEVTAALLILPALFDDFAMMSWPIPYFEEFLGKKFWYKLGVICRHDKVADTRIVWVENCNIDAK